MTGDKYPIQCSPNITVDELISYFMEIFCVKLTLKEFKEKVFFIYSADNLNKYGSETLKDMKIYNGAIITVNDQNDVIDFNLIKIKIELKEQSPKKLKNNLPLYKPSNFARANNKLNSNKSYGPLNLYEEFEDLNEKLDE